MYKLNGAHNQRNYKGNKIVITNSVGLELVNCLEAMPGIKTDGGIYGFRVNNINTVTKFFIPLIFNHKEIDGITFLTRCIDKRYWEYGNEWRLYLQIEDCKNSFSNFVYCYLESITAKGSESIKQAQSLIDNLNYHINHVNFLKSYNIDFNKFKTQKV